MTSAEWASWTQAVGGLVSALATITIAVMVYRYTKRRDKTAIIHDMWRQQQEWNIQAVSSALHSKAAELMIYGGDPENQEERDALRSCLFFFINRINYIYDGYCQGILSRSDFISESRTTVNLIAGQKDLAIRLLRHRGYDDAFCSELTSLINTAKTVEPVDGPNFQKATVNTPASSA